MTGKRHYSFEQQTFNEIVAHDGKGKVRTVRVRDEKEDPAFDFIDLTELPPDTSIGVHTHGPADEEVYVIVSGHGQMFLDGEEFIVGPGHVIVNGPGGTHALENIGDEMMQIVVLEVPVSNKPLSKSLAGNELFVFSRL